MKHAYYRYNKREMKFYYSYAKGLNQVKYFLVQIFLYQYILVPVQRIIIINLRAAKCHKLSVLELEYMYSITKYQIWLLQMWTSTLTCTEKC